MRIKKSTGEIVFDAFNAAFMILLMFVTLYPFVFVLFASISDPTEIAVHRGLLLFPKGFHFDAYSVVLENPMISIGYKNTLFYVVAGTLLNLLFTSLLSYSLSRKTLIIRNFLMKFVVFTMFFSGGMIPTYLMMTRLGMVNSRWAVIFPGLISTMNMIIMRTAFMSIPDSLEESAKLDGANDFVILFRIIIPLSMPTISVMILYYGVGHWNSWFNAMLYFRRRELYPLQMVLREILIFSSTDDMMVTLGNRKGQDMSEIIKYATIIVATVPILLVYPLLQKYFVKGVMIGAIKG